MDWFERLTGFRESGYEDTRRRLEVDGRRLRCEYNRHHFTCRHGMNAKSPTVKMHETSEANEANAGTDNAKKIGPVR